MSLHPLAELLGIALWARPERPSRRILQCPSCLRVSYSTEARWRAARALVRPREVSDLFRSVPNFSLPRDYSEAGSVAKWLENSFADGSLTYRSDPPDVDIWCSPARTRGTGGGDCDDLAILAGSMIAYAGAAPQIAIGYYCNGQTCDGHAWVEGEDRRGWFLLEATNGQLYRYRRPERYRIKQLIRPQKW